MKELVRSKFVWLLIVDVECMPLSALLIVLLYGSLTKHLSSFLMKLSFFSFLVLLLDVDVPFIVYHQMRSGYKIYWLIVGTFLLISCACYLLQLL